MTRTAKAGLYFGLVHLLLIVLTVEVVYLARELTTVRERTSSAAAISPHGKRVSLEGFDAVGANGWPDTSKPMLLFLFTSTCPFCSTAMNTWASLVDTVKSLSVDVAGVLLDKNPSDRQRRSVIQFPVLLPPDPVEFVRNIGVSGVPHTLYCDRDGAIVGSWMGVLTPDTLNSIITLLARKDRD